MIARAARVAAIVAIDIAHEKLDDAIDWIVDVLDAVVVALLKLETVL